MARKDVDSHPWLRLPPRLRAQLDGVSWDARGLFFALQMWAADTGTDGHVPKAKLPVVVSRSLPQKRIDAALAELVAEPGLVADRDASIELLVWEQPPLTVWQDEVEYFRWQRHNQFRKMRELKEQIKHRDRNLCRYCGRRVNWGDQKSPIGGTYDHVDPDGPNTLDNVVVSCRRCNGRKKDRTPEQAGMPLYKAGTTEAAVAVGVGSLRAASVAPAPVPEPRSGSDPVRTQSGPSPGSDSACAHARDRRDSIRIESGSNPGLAFTGAGRDAPGHREDDHEGDQC